MIKDVIKFQNGLVMVFDEKGNQLLDYQGRYEKVKAKILRDAPESATFSHGIWKMSGEAIPREEW